MGNVCTGDRLWLGPDDVWHARHRIHIVAERKPSYGLKQGDDTNLPELLRNGSGAPMSKRNRVSYSSVKA